MASRSKKKKLQHQGQSPLEALGIPPLDGEGIRAVDLKTGQELPEEETSQIAKTSKVLSDIVNPFMDRTMNPQDVEQLFNLAVIAWNLSLYDMETQASLVPVLKLNKNGLDTLDSLIERKLELYPDDRRYIESVEVRFVPGQRRFEIEATSTLPPK